MQAPRRSGGESRGRGSPSVTHPQPIAKEGAFFDEAEKIPLGGVVREEWRKAVVDERGRVERIPYELCVLVALRDGLLRREIWVPGANRWRNPEDDLPPDFEDNRDVHYNAIRPRLTVSASISSARAAASSANTSGSTGSSIAATGTAGGFAPRRAGPVGAGSPASIQPHVVSEIWLDPRGGLRDARTGEVSGRPPRCTRRAGRTGG